MSDDADDYPPIEDAAAWRQRFRDALPPMSDEDWDLACERVAARLRGEPHVHTRLCACGEEEPRG